MRFDWDKGNIDHIALHQVTPEEAEQVIENDPLDAVAVVRNGETRMVHLGETDAGRILAVILTERGEFYRVVTARPAERKERAFYLNHKAKNDEQHPEDP